MKTTKAKIYTNLILTINDKKKVVYSFISNNDGTRGFRFNILGLKGFLRLRKNFKSVVTVNKTNESFRQFHFFPLTIAFQKRSNPVKLSRTFAKVR